MPKTRTGKAQVLIVTAATGNWAFAVATLILALRRHNPRLAADFLLLHDKALPAHDCALLEKLGFRCQLFQPAALPLPPASLAQFSPLCLAKFYCFSALQEYETVLWLDADTVIQDDISEIFEMGPLSLALEDPEFSETHTTLPARVNVLRELPDLDGSCPNYNYGVIVFRRKLPARELALFCQEMLSTQASELRYPDQAVFNALVQKLQKTRPELFTPLPLTYNCHPRNPLALQAAIVHAFGAYKLWNDGLTAACFPEWQRDYARWLKLGGSPYRGPLDNAEYGKKGAFYLLRGFFDDLGRANACLEDLAAKLQKEQAARQKLEALLQRLSR